MSKEEYPAKQYKHAKICVFWDTLDCKIPRALTIDSVTDNIQMAIRGCNYLGEITIKAYRHSHKKFKAPSNRNVKFIVERGDEPARKKRIRTDIGEWTRNNRGGVVMCLYRDVSRDLSYVDEFINLNKAGYQVLLCQPVTADGVLLMCSKKVWRWESLQLGGSPIPFCEREELILRQCHSRHYINMTDEWRIGVEESETEEAKQKEMEREALRKSLESNLQT